MGPPRPIPSCELVARMTLLEHDSLRVNLLKHTHEHQAIPKTQKSCAGCLKNGTRAIPPKICSGSAKHQEFNILGGICMGVPPPARDSFWERDFGKRCARGSRKQSKININFTYGLPAYLPWELGAECLTGWIFIDWVAPKGEHSGSLGG